ncbi:GIY-YIG nuclease family protein [Cnuella takakiae]|nr:hypothetical protein BUE76_05655 [Cnuella takakiae]
MPFYVYIIQSEMDGSFYKGFTEEPAIRLNRHNNGETLSTRFKRPWHFVYMEQLPSKREALVRERGIKKYSREQITQLVHSSKNTLDR